MSEKKFKYEWTGEYREPDEGEFTLQGGGGPPIEASDAMLHSGFRYWILNRVEVRREA